MHSPGIDSKHNYFDGVETSSGEIDQLDALKIVSNQVTPKEVSQPHRFIQHGGNRVVGLPRYSIAARKNRRSFLALCGMTCNACLGYVKKCSQLTRINTARQLVRPDPGGQHNVQAESQ